MKTQNAGIVLLSISAVILFFACLFLNPQQQRAQGAFSVKDRDYMLTTVPMNRGGDALYVTDLRTGQMAIFVYDQNRRSVEPRKVVSLADLYK